MKPVLAQANKNRENLLFVWRNIKEILWFQDREETLLKLSDQHDLNNSPLPGLGQRKTGQRVVDEGTEHKIALQRAVTFRRLPGIPNRHGRAQATILQRYFNKHPK